MVPFEDQITFPDLATALGLSRPQLLREIQQNGLPCLERPRTRGGDYLFAKSAVLRWLYARIADAGRRAGPDGERLDIEVERARLTKEQADGAALRNAALRRDLLPADEVVAGWQSACGRMRSLLLGIPPGAAAEVVVLVRSFGDDAPGAEAAVRDLLAGQIDGALTELANTDADDDDEEQADDAVGEGNAAPGGDAGKGN